MMKPAAMVAEVLMAQRRADHAPARCCHQLPNRVISSALNPTRRHKRILSALPKWLHFAIALNGLRTKSTNDTRETT
jgi:hypothetical protein